MYQCSYGEDVAYGRTMDAEDRDRVSRHLNEALTRDESEEKDFHIRNALHVLGAADGDEG